MVVFDASILMLALDPATRAPQGVERAAERVLYLLETLTQIPDSKAGIPAPVLCEVLIGAGNAYDRYLHTLNDEPFVILPFDYDAALEAAGAISTDGLRAGARGPGTTRAKIKFDHQIVAIAKVNGADAIYSDDKEVIRLAQKAGLAAQRSTDLDMPPAPAQGNGS